MSEPIVTNRLVLRQFAAGDAFWMAREIANPAVHRWLTSPPSPYGLGDAQDFIAAMKDDPKLRVIELDRTPVGVISITPGFEGLPDLGYWLCEPAWGQGVMTEASLAFLDWYAIDGVFPITSGWISGNDRSAAVLRKLGFQDAGSKFAHSNFRDAEVEVLRVKLDGWGPLVSARTDRLVLDAMRPDDFDFIHKEFGRPDVARMVSSVIPDWNVDQARKWMDLRRVQSKAGFGCFIRLQDGTPIGSVGIGGDGPTLGYMLAKYHWGRGYGTEAVAAFLQAVFDRFPDWEKVDAEVFDDNAGSIGVLRKLGFTPIGATGCESLGRVEKSPSTLYRLARQDLKAHT